MQLDETWPNQQGRPQTDKYFPVIGEKNGQKKNFMGWKRVPDVWDYSFYFLLYSPISGTDMRGPILAGDKKTSIVIDV